MSDNSTPSTRFDGFTNDFELRQASHNVPAARFMADDGSEFPQWEEKKLGSLLVQYKQMASKDGLYPHVSLTKEGVIPKTERYNRDFLVRQQDKQYRVTHKNDICYNPANLKFGVICRNKFGDGIFSPIYITYHVETGFLPEFIEALVTREDFINHALRFQEGTVYERMAVSPDDLEKMEVTIPSLPEQKKIADCLSSVDETLYLCQRKLDLLMQAKKALMQQIFSQKLRFKADDGSDFPEWEEKKLGEMAILRNGYAFSSSTYVPNGYYHIITIANVRGEHFITVDSSTSTIDELPKNIAHWQVLKENDILISLTGNVGRVSLNRGSNNLLNQRVGLLEVNSTELNVEYLYQRISSADFEQAMLNAGQGAAQQNISKYDIENFRVSIPSLPEQKKIASCLSSADALIDQARAELEQWREVKKSLLQQLFV